MWENMDLWRLFGDRDADFATIGNQQSRPDAALVEKIANSVDARFTKACLCVGVDAAPRDDESRNSRPVNTLKALTASATTFTSSYDRNTILSRKGECLISNLSRILAACSSSVTTTASGWPTAAR